jgi:hypothetical protein
MQQVIIEIDETGKAELSVQGCAGPGCQKLSEGISKALGSTVSDVKTPEFHRSATQGQQAKAGQ